MKYIWEEQDIIPGRIVCLNNGSAEHWMIAGDKIYLMFMSDGMVLEFQTKAAIVDHLNSSKLIPLFGHVKNG
jgi:hypothetical protein